jgi:hypothetical protein
MGGAGGRRRAPTVALRPPAADETNDTEKAGRPERGGCWGAWPRGDGGRCTPEEPVGGELAAGAGSLGGGGWWRRGESIRWRRCGEIVKDKMERRKI